ncbi:SLAP domain-containing protein [Bacillus sp. FJAT-45350]|uniref:SLAP domain-containing protein n=1 Tax=Bacillus sp. FJAT-45350 TaxID=2011014 RepID=UPI0015C8349E|nr:SLAP domain-containing protein [Bacillus sp. FJAT-45350]
MKTLQANSYTINIPDNYVQSIPEQQFTNIQETIEEITLPENEAGIISLDVQANEKGLLVFVLLFNTTTEEVQDKNIEFRLYDEKDELCAAGYMAEANLPVLKQNEIYFWHFFFPNEAFVKKDVGLATWRLNMQGKRDAYEEGKDIETTRQYSFYHILKNEQQTTNQIDTKAHITLMKSATEYKSELDLAKEDSDTVILSDEDKEK